MASPAPLILGEFLAREGGFTVIGPRLKGHGLTPEDMAQATAEDWIRSVEDAMQTLRQQCSRIFMTGLSMGGTLTLYMAAMYPNVFAGAVPINAAVFIDTPDLAALAFGRDLAVMPQRLSPASVLISKSQG
jgi:carboxylesterase